MSTDGLLILEGIDMNAPCFLEQQGCAFATYEFQAVQNLYGQIHVNRKKVER